MKVSVPPVAVKVVEAAPAGTVTDAGTFSPPVLLDNVTTVPPLGAAPESASVQVEGWRETTLVGEHANEDRPVAQFDTVTAPEAADIASGAPLE